MVEVCYRLWHREVHGADLSHQALHLLPSDAPFRGQDGDELIRFLKFLLLEGYRTGLCVNHPFPDFLHTGSVSLPHLELLRTHGVLGFSRQGREEPFEGRDRAVEELALSVWPPCTAFIMSYV